MNFTDFKTAVAKQFEKMSKLDLFRTGITKNAAANDAAKRKEKKQHLLGIIAQKEGEALTALSVDDLRKMVNDL